MANNCTFTQCSCWQALPQYCTTLHLVMVMVMVMVMVIVMVMVMVMVIVMVMVMVMGNLLPRKVPWLKIPMTPTKKVPSDAKQ